MHAGAGGQEDIRSHGPWVKAVVSCLTWVLGTEPGLHIFKSSVTREENGGPEWLRNSLVFRDVYIHTNLEILLPFVCLLRQANIWAAHRGLKLIHCVGKHAFELLTLPASISQGQGLQAWCCHAQQGHSYLTTFPLSANRLILRHLHWISVIHQAVTSTNFRWIQTMWSQEESAR